MGERPSDGWKRELGICVRIQSIALAQIKVNLTRISRSSVLSSKLAKLLFLSAIAMACVIIFTLGINPFMELLTW